MTLDTVRAPWPNTSARSDRSPRWSGDTSAMTLRVLAMVLTRRGLDPAPPVAAVGVALRDVDNPFARVPRAAVFAFAERAAALAADETFHLQATAHAEIGAFGALDFVVTMAPTLGVGLARVAAGYALVNAGLRVVPVVTSASAYLDLRAVHEARPHPVDVETLAVATATRVRRATSGRHGPIEVQLSGPDRGYRAAFEALVGCPVRYGATADRIVFDRASWDVRPATAHSALDTILAFVTEPVLQALVPTTGTVASVEAIVAERLADGGLSAAQVAAVLDLSPRTLHRRLAAEGESFGDLVDRVRLRVAQAELEAGRPIADIAERLGFSESAAFTRAYRRWTGSPPSAHRALGRLGAVR